MAADGPWRDGDDRANDQWCTENNKDSEYGTGDGYADDNRIDGVITIIEVL